MTHPSSAKSGFLVPSEELFLPNHEDDKEWFILVHRLLWSIQFPRVLNCAAKCSKTERKLLLKRILHRILRRILELEVDLKHV